MSGLGLFEIIPFFAATAICLGLVITWMVNSESKRNICRAEITKLKAQVDSLEKEKMALIENAGLSGSAGAHDPADETLIAELKEKNEVLEKETARLRTELQEAKSSLEEVYKAMCEQKEKKKGRV